MPLRVYCAVAEGVDIPGDMCLAMRDYTEYWVPVYTYVPVIGVLWKASFPQLG